VGISNAEYHGARSVTSAGPAFIEEPTQLLLAVIGFLIHASIQAARTRRHDPDRQDDRQVIVWDSLFGSGRLLI
jgi:hypothetical protein